MIRCKNCDVTNRVGAQFCRLCGVELYSTVELLPDVMAQERYKILGLLGKGGMGAVYRVEDQRLGGKILALKEMSSPHQPDSQEQAQALAAFQQEAQMLARLDHPNIPDITDFFSESGRHYIVMELVPGETLGKRLEGQEQPCTEQEVRDWALQLCDVLVYLHHQEPPVIFRDLKPANIMLTPQGRIKLIDFGIARFFKPGKGSDTLLMGTPGFAASEQWGQKQTDARSDIYSLGVVMHYLLTRHDPRQDLLHLPPVRQLNPAVSPQLEQIIQKATQPKSEARFQSVEQMKQALTSSEAFYRRSTSLASPSVEDLPPIAPTVPQHKINSSPRLPASSPPISDNSPPAEQSSTKRPLWLILLVLLFLVGASAVAGGIAINALSATPTPTEVGVVAPVDKTPTNASEQGQTVVPPVVEASQTAVKGEVVSANATSTRKPTFTPTAIPTATSPLPPTATPLPPTATALPPTAPPAVAPTAAPSSLGGQFTYSSCVGGNCDIYLWDFTTNLSQRLTQDAAIDKQAAWSPNGLELVLVSNRLDSREELYRYNLATNQVEQLSDGADNKAWPAWSPDGSQILYQKYNDATGGGPQIWSLTVGLNQARQLTQPTPGWNKTPQWAANGAKIVFSAAPGDTNRDGFVGDNDQRYVYIMDSVGNNVRPLTNEPAFYDMYPYVLPDGLHVVFSRHAKAAELNNNGAGELYLLNINSGELRALTFTSSDEVMARPSPNGDQFLIVRREGNRNNIYLASWNGRQLGEPVFIVAGNVPAWNPVVR